MNNNTFNVLFVPMKRPKEQLSSIIRKAGDIFNVEQAADVLGLTTTDSAKILARWAKQGWLSRIKRGLYSVVPIESSSTNIVLDDAWILVPELFSPGYIGGWSAAEHWDLTEQLFRDICIVTEQLVPKKKLEVGSNSFFLTRIKNSTEFGTKIIWRQNRKIFVSDPHKTILDMLYDPRLGGGALHVSDCVNEYFKSVYFDMKAIKDYTMKMGNGAIFKRLGFLSEKILGKNHELTKFCQANLTQGNTYFDPKIKERKLVTRWKLFVPTNLVERR